MRQFIVDCRGCGKICHSVTRVTITAGYCHGRQPFVAKIVIIIIISTIDFNNITAIAFGSLLLLLPLLMHPTNLSYTLCALRNNDNSASKSDSRNDGVHLDLPVGTPEWSRTRNRIESYAATAATAAAAARSFTLFCCWITPELSLDAWMVGCLLDGYGRRWRRRFRSCCWIAFLAAGGPPVGCLPACLHAYLLAMAVSPH